MDSKGMLSAAWMARPCLALLVCHDHAAGAVGYSCYTQRVTGRFAYERKSIGNVCSRRVVAIGIAAAPIAVIILIGRACCISSGG